MADTYVYDDSSVAKPASADDLIRDTNGFTNPNLHRRIHPVNGLPYPYVQSVGLTWAEANSLGYTWRNSAGECSDFYDSDYYPSEAVVTPEQDSSSAVRDLFPIKVAELPDEPIANVIYDFNGILYIYVVNELGDYGWQVFADSDGDAVIGSQVISAINERKNKKYSPSTYILNIQNRDSYRRKIDHYVSADESKDSSHNEIP